MMKLNSISLVLLAVLSTLVVSCSQDETVDERLTNGAIGFAPLLNHNTASRPTQTRGAKIIDGNTDADSDFDGFYVWAYTTDDAQYGTKNEMYMGTSGTYGVPIKKASSTDSNKGWTPEDKKTTGGYYGYVNENDLKYWPKDKLEFLAIAPLCNSSNPTGITNVGFTSIPATRPTTGGYSITYTAEADDGNTAANIDNHTDIMYATKRMQGTVGNSTVTLNFKHALAKLKFTGQVVANQPGMQVLIKSVTLHNLKTKGTCVITATDNDATMDWPTAQLNTYGDYTLLPPAAATNATCDEKIVTLSANNTVTSAGTQVALSEEFLIIPQTTTAWTTIKTNPKAISSISSNSESYLEIKCAIYQVAGVPIVGTYSNSKYTTESVYVPLGGTWEAGKFYTYNLQFGVGYNAAGKVISEPITFSVNVGSWTSTSEDVSL